MIRNPRDLFVALRNPYAARWSTLAPLPLVQPLARTMAVVAGPDDAEPTDDDDLDDEDDDEFDDDDEEAGDEDDENTEQTAEPDGQFPNAPNTLTDIERPGGPQNRRGDQGGVS